MVDYTINGLDSMTVELVMMGTSHFINNIIPSWYTIVDVTLVDNELTISFSPTDDLPKELHKPVNYGISAQPHADFAMFIKDTRKKTVKYVCLNCKTDSTGKPFFHYDILSKDNNGNEDGAIKRGVSVSKLLLDGYTLEKSYDDNKSTVVGVTLYEHKNRKVS